MSATSGTALRWLLMAAGCRTAGFHACSNATASLPLTFSLSCEAAGYAEVDKYDYSNPGFTPNAGGFSQLVWADTQRIGCAVAAGCRLPVVACQYYPAGVAGFPQGTG